MLRGRGRFISPLMVDAHHGIADVDCIDNVDEQRAEEGQHNPRDDKAEDAQGDGVPIALLRETRVRWDGSHRD